MPTRLSDGLPRSKLPNGWRSLSISSLEIGSVHRVISTLVYEAGEANPSLMKPSHALTSAFSQPVSATAHKTPTQNFIRTPPRAARLGAGWLNTCEHGCSTPHVFAVRLLYFAGRPTKADPCSAHCVHREGCSEPSGDFMVMRLAQEIPAPIAHDIECRTHAAGDTRRNETRNGRLSMCRSRLAHTPMVIAMCVLQGRTQPIGAIPSI